MLGKSGKGSKKGDYILDDSDANRILYDENGYIPNPNKVKKKKTTNANNYYLQTRNGKRVKVRKKRK